MMFPLVPVRAVRREVGAREPHRGAGAEQRDRPAPDAGRRSVISDGRAGAGAGVGAQHRVAVVVVDGVAAGVGRADGDRERHARDLGRGDRREGEVVGGARHHLDPGARHRGDGRVGLVGPGQRLGADRHERERELAEARGERAVDGRVRRDRSRTRGGRRRCSAPGSSSRRSRRR